LGGIEGPSVSSYTDRLNDTFGSSDRIEDFGPNFCLGLGVCASLSRHFSYQFNLDLYSFQTEGTFNYTNTQGDTISHRQELRFGGATFGLNVLLNPSLKIETRLWPFLGAGIGLASFYLDELVDVSGGGYYGGASARRTKIALGGGAVCGCVYKLSRRWGLIIQGEYLLSRAEMDFYLGDDQEIKLNQALLKVGTIYLY
jgi:opacity protein-like surface antigen